MKQSNVKLIGVTGGVGSGKSTVLDILKNEYNACVILADKVAHELMEPGAANYKAILEEFGPEILTEDDTAASTPGKAKAIDRDRLGKIVFSDPQKLEKLNKITHGGTENEIRRRIANYRQQAEAEDGSGSPDCARRLIAVEAALLIGSGLEPDLDSLWYVYAKDEERIRRLMKSRGYTEEYARSILSRQLSEEDFRKASQTVINNNGDLSETRREIKKALDTLFS